MRPLVLWGGVGEIVHMWKPNLAFVESSWFKLTSTIIALVSLVLEFLSRLAVRVNREWADRIVAILEPIPFMLIMFVALGGWLMAAWDSVTSKKRIVFLILLCVSFGFRLGWTGIEGWFGGSESKSFVPARFECQKYSIDFVELEVMEYREVMCPVRVQFMVWVEGRTTEPQYKYQTLQMDGSMSYDLDPEFKKVQVNDHSVVIEMRAMNPSDRATTGWTWPIIRINCQNPDAYTDGVMEKTDTSSAGIFTLRYTVSCAD